MGCDTMAQWILIKRDYIAGDLTVREIAARYGISERAIQRTAAKEDWKSLRKAHQDATLDRALALMEEYRAQKLARMEVVSRELLERISHAIGELDQQVLREVVKEKEILYENPQRADKATKEIITERENLVRVKTPIDRNGIKLLAAALKDVKDVQMLRDPMDLQEQEAKIAKLQRETCEEGTDRALRVEFSTETEGCSE